MKPLKILVTGVGGMIGIGIIKSLRKEFGKKDIKIVGTDSSPFAACSYLPGFLDSFFLVPEAKSRNYLERIFSIAKKKKVNLIFPGTDHEILPLSEKKDIFCKIGTKIIVSCPETIKICRDKWLTYKTFKNILPIVKSFLPKENLDLIIRSLGLPLIVKPRFGWGSRGIYRADSSLEFKAFLKKVKKPIIQKWLDGQEYTVDGLVSEKGKFICVVPRERIATLAGVSCQGITVRDKELIKLGKRLVENLKIRGPFNFQVKKERNKYFIFEINPRFAGTGILSTAAGVNIPALAVKDILGMKIPKKIDFKENVRITRYIEDVFISKKT